jgi:hypothetical protein
MRDYQDFNLLRFIEGSRDALRLKRERIWTLLF